MHREITFLKGPQTYAFDYLPGQEREVIGHLMELADDPESNLDWLDAAMLSFQIARQASEACRRTLTAGSVRE